MKVKVIVTLKDGVLDPQGKAIQQTLGGMGFSKINEVKSFSKPLVFNSYNVS